MSDAYLPPPAPRLRPLTKPHHLGSASPVTFDMEMLNSDPMISFSSPVAPEDEDEDEEDLIFDLDAGIQDTGHPRRQAGIIKPSRLDSCHHPFSMRPGSLFRIPSFSSCTSASDTESELDSIFDENDGDDDEYEGYVRYSPASYFPNSNSLAVGRLDKLPARPRTRRNHRFMPSHRLTSRPSVGYAGASFGGSSYGPVGSMQFANSTPQSSPSLSQSSRRQKTSLSSSPTSPSWREPSPSVWSISEEEEGASIMEEEDKGTARLVDQTGKPKKKVRFVLPAEVI